MRILATAVNWFAEIIEWALIVRAIMSWFVSNPYSTAGKIYSFLLNITEPIVAPIRNALTKNRATGGVDWSLLIAFLIIDVVQGILVRILLML